MTGETNAGEDVLTWWGDTAGSGGAHITVDADGALTGLRLGAGEQLVGGLGVRGIGGEPYHPDRVRVDADEIETSGTCAGVDVRVRHSFDHVWHLRIGLTNPGDRPVRLGRLLLDIAAGDDGWLDVFAGGAVAYLTFHRLASSRCLALRLIRGDLVTGPDGVGTPEVELAPGGRYQLVLSGEWYAGPAAVRQRFPAWFPDSLDHVAGDRVDPLIEHPDVAVTIRRSEGDPDFDLLEVAEPRGVTHLRVAYVDEERSYGRVTRQLLARGELLSAAEALVVLRGVASHEVGRDEAAGLIESYLDRPRDPSGPLRVILLLRAQEVLGEDRAELAAEELLALPPGPGVPLATLHLLAAGRQRMERPGAAPSVAIDDVIGRLVHLLGDPATDPVTVAELRILVSGGTDAVRERMSRALREVELLCSTEPGELWPARPDADIARAVVVRSLLPSPTTEHPVIHKRLRRLVARAATAPDGMETLAWLLSLTAADWSG